MRHHLHQHPRHGDSDRETGCHPDHIDDESLAPQESTEMMRLGAQRQQDGKGPPPLLEAKSKNEADGTSHDREGEHKLQRRQTMQVDSDE